MNNPFKSADWTHASLTNMWETIDKLAKDEYKLDYYPPYFELVTFEEMLHIYTTSFPIMFHHWSFGKEYEQNYRQYKANMKSIAYEVIFNTNPALCYLMENNSSIEMATTMAHAAVGHSSFFKTNAFIRENTSPNTIVSFLKNVRQFVTDCEQKYGAKRVEKILDVCKTFELHSMDRAEVLELSRDIKDKKRQNRIEEASKDFDLLVEDLRPANKPKLGLIKGLKEENILKYIAKHSPNLKQWERDLILMFCKISQYFYPQMFTKLMNEGYATFWHYTLMTRLHELGQIDDGGYLEFLDFHTMVITQRDHDQRGYSGINPYKLGFEMFKDIRRICENPTEEDRKYSPNLIGKNWLEEIKYAVENFKDESFIQQYLSPKIVRDLKLFKYKDNTDYEFYSIEAVHSDEDYKQIRTDLSESYNLFNKIPLVYIEGSDLKRTRTLYIGVKETIDARTNIAQFGQSLDLLKELWPFPIRVKYIEFNGEIFKGDLI